MHPGSGRDRANCGDRMGAVACQARTPLWVGCGGLGWTLTLVPPLSREEFYPSTSDTLTTRLAADHPDRRATTHTHTRSR